MRKPGDVHFTNSSANEKDLYDFSDVSDLPEELASKLVKETSDAAARYAEIVNNAPRALNISEIVAVAIRKFGAKNVPMAQTVRGYLNAAVENGWITKKSRQMYAAGGATQSVR